MDIIKLDKVTFNGGSYVNGIKTIEWIERYQEPGEFTITADPTDDIRTTLSLGSLITHLDTKEVMFVEDHEIDESGDESPVLTITGRSFTSFLEQRLSSGNNFGLKNPVNDQTYLYDFLSRTSVANLLVLLQEQLTAGQIAAQDIIPNLTVSAAFTGTDPAKEMVAKRGQLWPAVLNLLEEMDAGLKFERPVGFETGAKLIIHKGTDLTATVRFSDFYGDLSDTRYFWTNRRKKNGTLVVGEYTSKVMRPTGVSGLDVRMLWTDASDYGAKPITGPELTTADNVLTRRGNESLAEWYQRQYLETKINPNSRYTFRRDYNIGDIVYVIGNYGVSQPMRVTEFAEFEDESGESGVPTVSALNS